MAVLQVVKGPNVGEVIALDRPRSILGRHPECEVRLDVGAVSRQHAQIVRVGDGEFFVEDLQSRNGTYVNNQLIAGPQRLTDRDRLKICDVLFTFHLSDPNLRATDPALSVSEDETGSATVMSAVEIIPTETGALRIAVSPQKQLQAVLDIARNLGSALELDDVLSRILGSLFQMFAQADRGFVLLRDAESQRLIPAAVKHRRAADEESIRYSRTIVHQAMDTKRAILSADAGNDSRFDMSQSIADLRIRSVMCLPLVDSNDAVLGVISIDTFDQRSRFSSEDLDMLASIARQVAMGVENAQLHESLIRKKSIERDLELARQVQQGFLPLSRPTLAGFAFFDYYDPANEVGGDHFDYIPLPGGRLAIVVADVSGKGVSAALLMAKVSSDIRFCLLAEPTLAAAVRRLNANFSGGRWEDRFITLILAVLDPDRLQATLVNAGHMAPLIRDSEGVVRAVGVNESGVPLGVDVEFPYEECVVPLTAGDLLIMYTDGISEALSESNELYSNARLEKVLSQGSAGVDATGRTILDDVRKHVGTRDQSDDMCLICVEALCEASGKPRS